MPYSPGQLPLLIICGICGGLAVSTDATGRPDPRHNACGRALDRWVRDDNVDYLLAADPPWHRQAAQ